ncbi:unnamed protein product [Staurois parvus]|uniref:Uncharacterized protein n=1 Tax=Staurois parvus TaxID=386267 RepID=A0ABN9FK78_9NEOB|nr:unnamed protein product [Staurois parvus]
MPRHQCAETIFYHWFYLEKNSAITGVNGRNGVPSLVSVGGIMPQGPDKGNKWPHPGPRVTVWRPLLYPAVLLK